VIQNDNISKLNTGTYRFHKDGETIEFYSDKPVKMPTLTFPEIIAWLNK